jgi:hypothetical protein
MDRPARVARVRQHNNDDLVQYLPFMKQEESLGAAVIQGVAVLLLLRLIPYQTKKK